MASWLGRGRKRFLLSGSLALDGDGLIASFPSRTPATAPGAFLKDLK
jgi:hypothetical protein